MTTGAQMRRMLALFVAAGLVLGGGAVAFAATGDGAVDPAARAAAKECIRQARGDHAGDRAAIRAAARECLTAAGIDPAKGGHARKGAREEVRKLTPEQRAALKECVKVARGTHTDDRSGRRDAVRACLAQAGINRPAP